MVTHVKVPFLETIDGKRFGIADEVSAHRHESRWHMDKAHKIVRDKSNYHSTADALLNFCMAISDPNQYTIEALRRIVDGLNAEITARDVAESIPPGRAGGQ